MALRFYIIFKAVCHFAYWLFTFMSTECIIMVDDYPFQVLPGWGKWSNMYVVFSKEFIDSLTPEELERLEKTMNECEDEDE